MDAALGMVLLGKEWALIHIHAKKWTRRFLDERPCEWGCAINIAECRLKLSIYSGGLHLRV